MARPWCAILLVWLLLAQAASAEEAEESTGEEVPLPAAQTAEQTPAESPPAEETADLGTIEVLAEALSLATRALPGQTVTVLTCNDWGTAARSVADVLEQSAPVSVARTGGEGSLATLSLRAAGSADTLVLLNGVPVALPGGTPVDLNLLSLESVERIEIIPGAASLHGTRAIGGIVNIVTRGSSEEKEATTLELAAGSLATVSGNLMRVDNRAGVQDTLCASLFTTRGNFDFVTVNGLLRTRRNNDAQRLNLLWQRQAYSATRLRTSFVSLAALRREVPGFAEFPTEQARLTEEILTAGVSSLRPATEGGWQREAALALTQSFVRFRDDAPIMGAPVRSRASQYDIRGNVLFRREEADGYAEMALSLAGEMMDATDYGNPRRLSSRLSILRSWESPSFGVAPALAVDWREGEAPEPSWDFVASWRPQHGVAVGAAAGRSFRFPEFVELYYPAQGFVRGNPELLPERAHYASVGVQLAGRNCEFSVDAYLREQHNIIRFLPVSACAIRPLNTGRTRARGLEASGRVEFTRHLSARASYALTDAEFVRSGIDMAQTPRYRFHGSLAYNDDEWGMELAHFRESAQSADLFGSVRVRGKALWDLSLVRQREERGGKLSLAIRNLFDESARDFWDLPLPGRSVEISWKSTL